MEPLLIDVAGRSRTIPLLNRGSPTARVRRLGRALQAGPLEPARVLAELDAHGSPATVATAGGR